MEPATTPYSCHGVFTDQSIFSLNFSRIQIPTGTLVTNCNHKHRLILTCRHDVDMFNCCILTEARSCRLELAYFAEKISKNRLACKNAIVFAYYGSCRLLVSGSCFCSFLKNRRILLFLWISKINVAFVKTFQESYLVDDLART